MCCLALVSVSSFQYSVPAAHANKTKHITKSSLQPGSASKEPDVPSLFLTNVVSSTYTS